MFFNPENKVKLNIFLKMLRRLFDHMTFRITDYLTTSEIKGAKYKVEEGESYYGENNFKL